MSRKAEYARKRYRLLKSHRMCVLCTARLPKEDTRTRCPSCREKESPGALERDAIRDRRPAAQPEYAGPMVAHCGGWHPITEAPFTAPCCGAEVLR